MRSTRAGRSIRTCCCPEVYRALAFVAGDGLVEVEVLDRVGGAVDARRGLAGPEQRHRVGAPVGREPDGGEPVRPRGVDARARVEVGRDGDAAYERGVDA